MYQKIINESLKQLKINYIRGSGKGGQKRNKTSSTVQIIDYFNYLPYIPKENIKKVKSPIIIKIDIGRSKEKNLEYAIEKWKRKIKSYFTVPKKRKIDLKKEKERKEKLKKIYKEKSGKLKYKTRYYV